MDRRSLIKGTTALAGAAVSGNILASSVMMGGGKGSPRRNLFISLGSCIALCEQCESHCIEMLARGHTQYLSALRKTRECLAICKAMLTLSTFDADHLRELASLCITVCNECAAECDTHAAHSEICRECAQACRDCAAQCAAIA